MTVRRAGLLVIAATLLLVAGACSGRTSQSLRQRTGHPGGHRPHRPHHPSSTTRPLTRPTSPPTEPTLSPGPASAGAEGALEAAFVTAGMSSTRAACVADALATQAGDADVEHVADVYRRGGSIADLSDALFSALTDAAAGCVQGGGASSPTTSTPGSTVAPTTTSPGGHGSTPPSRASTSSSQAVAQALLQSDDHYTTKQASCVAGQLVADLGRSEYDQLLAYLEGRSKGADNGVIEVYNDARAVCGVGS